MKHLSYFWVNSLVLLLVLDANADQAIERRPETVSAYLDALYEAEEEHGPYGEASADIYFGLGNALQANREYEQARDAYLRGMQVRRINNGLYDVGQIPYLNVLADLAKSQRGWSDAADYLQQAYAIQLNNYESDDPLLTQSLRARIDLHLMAYEEMGAAGHEHLTSAFKVDSRTVQGALPDPSKQLDEYLAMMKRSVMINYEMAVLTYSGEVSKDKFFSAQESTMSSLQDPTTYYLKGRAGLTHMVKAVQQHSSDPIQVAGAHADLGDWYLLFDKRSSALEQYKIAYSIVEKQENGTELAAKMFSTPLMLPRFQLPRAFPDNEKSYKLRYSLTVLKTGKARSVKLIEQPDSVPVGVLRRARTYFRSAKFRPYMVDGMPLKKENHTVLLNVQ